MAATIYHVDQCTKGHDFRLTADLLINYVPNLWLQKVTMSVNLAKLITYEYNASQHSNIIIAMRTFISLCQQWVYFSCPIYDIFVDILNRTDYRNQKEVI